MDCVESSPALRSCRIALRVGPWASHPEGPFGGRSEFVGHLRRPARSRRCLVTTVDPMLLSQPPFDSGVVRAVAEVLRPQAVVAGDALRDLDPESVAYLARYWHVAPALWLKLRDCPGVPAVVRDRVRTEFWRNARANAALRTAANDLFARLNAGGRAPGPQGRLPVVRPAGRTFGYEVHGRSRPARPARPGSPRIRDLVLDRFRPRRRLGYRCEAPLAQVDPAGGWSGRRDSQDALAGGRDTGSRGFLRLIDPDRERRRGRSAPL